MSTAASHAVAVPHPAVRPQGVAWQVIATVTASLFVALCAHVSLPLLFTPVPLTLGNFAVLLVGLFLGPRLGFAALALYLGEGALGLPVFNPGGAGGLAQLLGATGGYLLAYPLAAAVAGWLAVRLSARSSRFVAGLTGSVTGTMLLLTTGVLWLAYFAHLSTVHALQAGLLPFLPGELLKIAIAAGMFATLSRK